MDFQLPDAVLARIRAVLPEAIELRHRLHRFPETKFEERRTMAAIRDYLSGGAVELLDPLIGTDTVGLLGGRKPGPTVLLRADIDALPLQESSGKPWSSANPGRAHACGHDGHAAMLLAAARVLGQSAEDLAGSVRFVFQPAEEEQGGGRALIEKGLLDLQPRPDVAFALHGWSGIPLGKAGAAPGAAMAGSDNFVVQVKGRGGHGGQPHRAADAVVAAAQAIVGMQTIVSRNVDPLKPVVVSVCNVRGGDTMNVLPEEVVFGGTIRFFDPGVRDLVWGRMESILAGVCEAAGCSHSLEYLEGYVPMVNDAGAVSAARAMAVAALGQEAWSGDEPPSMAAEDFAYYLGRMPGCLIRLGLGTDWPPLHSPAFDFNDDAMEAGIRLLVALAMGYAAAVRT